MSRDISRQQQQILGLCVGLSRINRSEITVAFAAVVLAGVPLVRTRTGLTGLQRSPAALTARTGVVRRFASLVKRDLLVRCLPPTSDPKWGLWGKLRGGNYQGSYALTDAGRAASLPYEITITDEMQQILRLLEGRLWRHQRWSPPEELSRLSAPLDQ